MTTALGNLPGNLPSAGALISGERVADVEPATQHHARDVAAALAALLIVILFHIQDVFLSQNSQIGLAFRNVALRRVLLVALALATYGLYALNRRDRIALGSRQPSWLPVLNAAALAILILFLVHGALVVFLTVNLFAGGAVGALLEYTALIAVLILAAPWERLRLYRRSLVRFGPALLIAMGVLGAWEGLVSVFDIKQFLLPRPSVIATTFLDVYPKLVSAGWFTFQNALWGYVVGCGAGILFGLFSTRFSSFSRAILPFAIAANSIPIIAFAPIMNFWFGTLDPKSKVAIVAVITFFPAMINTVRGLTSADPAALELMRSYAARELEIFRKVRLPAALPYIFSALKIATTLSMIGAVIGEFFGGSIAGIGFRIRNDPSNFDFADAWASILVVSVLGILFYTVVSLIERLVMPWHVSLRDKSV